MANPQSTASSQERTMEVTPGEAQIYESGANSAGVNVYDRPVQTRSTGASILNIVILLLVVLVLVYFLLQWIA
jgi:hypothetical protein